MKLLEKIEKGKMLVPLRTTIFGTQAVGKSTFASMSEKPIFIQTEDGLARIDCDKFPLSQNFEEVMEAITELYAEKHPYATVVVDSLDWLERLIWLDVCRKRNVENIEDIGFARGYTYALTQWRLFLDALSALRNNKNMGIIFIAHAKIERFENPETETYDRYVPRIHKLASAVIQEWCDNVLFATYKVHTTQSDAGFNRKRIKAIGTGERVIYTTERPAYVAKNRFNLPEELPLDWNIFMEHINKNIGGN